MRNVLLLGSLAAFLFAAQPSAQQFVAELAPAMLAHAPAAAHVVGGNGVVYCRSDIPGFGAELCATDGTVGGTRLFADLAPGMTSSNARPLAVIGSSVLVNANNAVMLTDGTPTGTQTLLSGLNQYFTFRFLGRAGTRFVWAQQLTSFEAWRVFGSDGTASGTRELGTVISVVGSAERNGLLTIGADSGTTALQMFVSDGLTLTPFATLPIAGRSGFAPLGSYDYFVLEDATSQTALWRTDGTTSGTTFVTALGPAQGTCSIVSFGSGLWIGAANQLWSSDGTVSGTVALPIALRAVDGLTPVGNLLVFKNGRFGGTGGTREELWSTDGTVANTGPIHTAFSYYGAFEVGATRAFCRADASGRNLLRTDGTAAGTVSIPLDRNEFGTSIAVLGNDAITAMFRQFPAWPNQMALFKTDATNAGTILLSQMTAPAGVRTLVPGEAFGTTLCFAANTNTNGAPVLWRTDGTLQGTRIATGTPIAVPALHRFRGAIWYAQLFDVWRYDPATDSSAQALAQVAGQTAVRVLGVADDYLILQTISATNSGIWRSDGTASGTVRIGALGVLDTVPVFAQVGNTTYWVISRLGFVHLYRGDPTPGSVVDLGVSTTWLGRIGDRLLFARPATPAAGFDLFAISPTSPVPQLVANVPLAPSFSHAVGSQLICVPSGGVPFVTDGVSSVTPLPMPPVRAPWFVADGFVHASTVATTASASLWRTDGTAAGTTVAVTFGPGELAGLVEAGALGAGNRIFLQASDGVSGSEPWISAGTQGSTTLLADLVPNGSSSPQLLGVAGERGYFIAFDPLRGRELWSFDLATVGAASAQPYGAGCVGSNGIPQLVVDGMPAIGRTLSLRLQRGAANALGLWFVGLGPQRLPIGGGCEFLMTTVAWSDWALTDAAGAASTALVVPNVPAFVGLPVVAQAACLDALAPAGLGVTSSEGVLLVLGG